MTAAASASFMELRDVSRVYPGVVPVHALREVDLTIQAGEFVSITGPSGSGKSTLLGLLGLLDQPTSGRITVAGEDVTRASDAHRTRLRGRVLGFVFQQFHLIPHLTAAGNVETALLYRSLRPRERRDRAREALERVGLGPRADHRPTELSGGEQQRVAMARAIVTDPRIVLADEPTGALDSANAENIMDVLSSLVDDDRAVVMVTHDPELADRADRRVRMRDGSIVEVGPPLRREPASTAEATALAGVGDGRAEPTAPLVLPRSDRPER
ncbi:MAG: ABC transporter ATP-binding protein [Actinomycetota bacterium]